MLYSFVIAKEKEGLLSAGFGLRVKRLRWRALERDESKIVVHVEVEEEGKGVGEVMGVIRRAFGCENVYYKSI